MTSHRATLDDSAGGILELGDSDSGAEDATLPRQRPQWTRIWRTTNTDGLAEFRASLPTQAVGKSNQVGCTINHLLDHDYNLHRCSHTMRSQMVHCTSQRCKKKLQRVNDGISRLNPRCCCRYKFNLCLSSSTCEEYIRNVLNGGEKTTATRLPTLLGVLVADQMMAGPAPKHTQVADFVKNWRRRNPKDSMAPLIALCDGRLYDQIDVAAHPDTEMVILCDLQTTPNESADLVSHRGDGSSAYPLRVGVTCLRLVRDYVAVQSRPESTTILHVFPLVFYCTSQKRATDIGWCIRYLKRVCMDACNVDFMPQFVMTDADKAQF
ncbi:unnamed protein product [Phytophthora fragariaefolia]|uniref:Unnamed protein product n=1 Tax=Phytophthora fragariaefolia TaxID=1490495 RepID=A0A9W6TUC3_9STRA|nr:unnamed protein product [Phytophthora fragariaefolia]